MKTFNFFGLKITVEQKNGKSEIPEDLKPGIERGAEIVKKLDEEESLRIQLHENETLVKYIRESFNKYIEEKIDIAVKIQEKYPKKTMNDVVEISNVMKKVRL